MSGIFSPFPPEIRAKIYSYCSTNDLINVGRCNKESYGSVQYLIWSAVNVQWWQLENLTEVEQKLGHLHLTTRLRLHVLNIFDPINNENNRAKSFNRILNSCHSEHLKKLEIHRYMIPKGVRKISQGLRELQELNISFIYTPYINDWSYICSMTNLTKLYLHDCNIHDDNLIGIHQLVHLRELVIEYCLKLTRVCLPYLTKVASVRRLALSDCWNMYNSTHSIGELTNLRELVLTSVPIEDDFFKDAGNTIQGLMSLVTTSRDLTDVGMSHISKLTSLTDLDLTHCHKLTDRGLACLSQLTLLRKLFLSNCKEITDVGLKHVSKLKLLTYLDIGECKQVTDDGIYHVARISVLSWLNCYRCDLLTDTAMEYISQLPLLQMLDISSCELITDVGLTCLLKLNSLSLLSVYGLRDELVSEEVLKKLSDAVSIVRY